MTWVLSLEIKHSLAPLRTEKLICLRAERGSKEIANLRVIGVPQSAKVS